MMKEYFVYILTNKHNRVFYVGITNDLNRRIHEHRNSNYCSFCKRYNIYKLVYFESCSVSLDAIQKEKQLKKWSRAKKIKLIEQLNPGWKDFAEYLNLESH